VLFSEPKIPQFPRNRFRDLRLPVSVLFSEPKIPQCALKVVDTRASIVFQCSSASRKFLNTWSVLSSTKRIKFQCSSASRKFLNLVLLPSALPDDVVSVLFSEPKIPQSESRRTIRRRLQRFSALQRAENSSIEETSTSLLQRPRVSVLFSEPKIPQSVAFLYFYGGTPVVSVLFSEPKIPQSLTFLSTPRPSGVSVLFSEPKIPQ